MRNFLPYTLSLFSFFFTNIFAERAYVAGQDATNSPIYWIIELPDLSSTKESLQLTDSSFGIARTVQISPSEIVWIAGQQNFDESSGAGYWTISPPSPVTNFNALGSGSLANASINGVAFNYSGFGCLVGVNDTGNAAYWTIDSSGITSEPFEITTNGFGIGVAFASSGNGFIAGMNGESQATYWPISDTGTLGSAVPLPSGAANGTNVYTTAISPSGTLYVVGSTQDGIACYWTDTTTGTPSPTVHILEGVGSNSSARGIAFLPSGEGLIVGQGSGNTAVYWRIASDGTVGSIQLLPHGSGAGSFASGVAFSADETAYIIGLDDSNNGVFWTVSSSDSDIVNYEILADGAGSGAYAITIPSSLSPPTNLSASYKTNDFALLYEYCAVLTWSLSASPEVVAYNIYQDGIKIGTVTSPISQYQNHNQNPSQSSIYSVKGVNASGIESQAVTVTLN